MIDSCTNGRNRDIDALQVEVTHDEIENPAAELRVARARKSFMLTIIIKFEL